MSTRIRLQRHGKKSHPFYKIVVTDSRKSRNGKFIKKLGFYNPLKTPSIIKLNIDHSIDWLKKGAQPTNTVKSIFYKMGIFYKLYLIKAVQKGVLKPEHIENKMKIWLQKKKDIE
jgi:small subunit ribosomal protein S16